MVGTVRPNREEELFQPWPPGNRQHQELCISECTIDNVHWMYIDKNLQRKIRNYNQDMKRRDTKRNHWLFSNHHEISPAQTFQAMRNAR